MGDKDKRRGVGKGWSVPSVLIGTIVMYVVILGLFLMALVRRR